MNLSFGGFSSAEGDGSGLGGGGTEAGRSGTNGGVGDDCGTNMLKAIWIPGSQVGRALVHTCKWVGAWVF